MAESRRGPLLDYLALPFVQTRGCLADRLSRWFQGIILRVTDTLPEKHLAPFQRTVLIALAVILVVGFGANILFFHATVTAEPVIIGAAGLWLSIWGLGLSIVGFGITWWQLHRSRSAAQRVANALNAVRKDYASFDVISELRTAQAAGEDTQSCLDNGRWQDSIFAYNKLRVSLMKMASVQGGLESDDIGTAKDAVADIVAACSMISENKGDGSEAIPTIEMVSKLRAVDNFLIALEQKLKGKISVDHK